MARLFITPRELDFINDTTKELIKDVVGQKVYYYKVCPDATSIHVVYEEALNKIFYPPVEIECRIEYQPSTVRTNKYGVEDVYKIEAFFHARDLLERDIEIHEGDFFSYDANWFEIMSESVQSIIYGQIEHSMGIKITAITARKGLLDIDSLGPTSESYTEKGAIQETFVQQRGFEENSQGPTADIRNMQEKGVLDAPISGPGEVSKRGGDGITSSFYDDY
jgi:hypothetical protein